MRANSKWKSMQYIHAQLKQCEYEKKRNSLQQEYLFNLKNKANFDFTKKTSNLFREKKQDIKKIDVSNFNQVININFKKNIAECEAMIRFDDLSRETLKYDYTPPVVPELKTITLGGAISGVGIEASSFKFGLVHESVLEMEVMLANGEIVVCNPDNKYRDLFYALPNSYGTLGYILKVKIPLVKTKKYVELQYEQFENSRDFFSAITKQCQEKKDDYIDGVIFSEREMYIIKSNFIDKAPYHSNYTYLHIYYQSIRHKIKDYLTIYDFIWRWDTDWFWCSKIFGMQNPILRLLFGKFALGSRAYWSISRFEEKYKIRNRIEKLFTGKIKHTESVVQDVCIPAENAQSFLAFYWKHINIRPIWICPIKPYKNISYPLFKMQQKLYLDFGFWDIIQKDVPKGYHNKLIEKEVEKLGGMKSLYSESYYEENKFWQIYDGKYYKKLKLKYDPDYIFSDLYSRCVKNK